MNKLITGVIAIIFLAAVFFVIDGRREDSQNNTNNNNNEINDMNTAQDSDISITPISHATMVINWGGKVIYTDPVGGAEAFANQPKPNLILVTDIHSDHLDLDTLEKVATNETVLVLPKAVADQSKNLLPGLPMVLNNGETTNKEGFSIEAIPMYNVPEAAEAFHTKGRGNGYVIEMNGKRVYISGDTGNTPEMRALKNIDIAFVSMNLPYTMSVEDAAAGVLAFKPKRVSPYHYRGQSGLSDVNKFRDLVNAGDSNITVDLINFYPES